MDWFSLVEEKCSIKIDKCVKIFSRRNEVFSIEGVGEKAQSVKYAVKIYRQNDIFQEPFILKELAAAKVKVPKVIWYDENMMVTEFISGILLADLMGKKDGTQTQTPPWTAILARWLYSLHSTQKIQGVTITRKAPFALASLAANGESHFYHKVWYSSSLKPFTRLIPFVSNGRIIMDGFSCISLMISPSVIMFTSGRSFL